MGMQQIVILMGLRWTVVIMHMSHFRRVHIVLLEILIFMMPIGGGGKGYGIMVQNTSGDCLIENNIFRHLRHSMILQAGSNGNVFGYNYSIDPYWTEVSLPSNAAGDIVLHGNYVYANLFEGNLGQQIVIDDSHGINVSIILF
jgi:hypothetical protein